MYRNYWFTLLLLPILFCSSPHLFAQSTGGAGIPVCQSLQPFTEDYCEPVIITVNSMPEWNSYLGGLENRLYGIAQHLGIVYCMAGSCQNGTCDPDVQMEFVPTIFKRTFQNGGTIEIIGEICVKVTINCGCD